MIVLTDRRWPAWTGIGRMASFYADHRPAGIELQDVQARAGIGSPASPFSLSRAVRRHAANARVFWNPGFIPAPFSPVRTVVTVHDLTHLHFYSRFHKLYYNMFLKPMYLGTDRIICISEFTRNEFLQWSGMEPGRVEVIYNSLPPGFADQADAPLASRPYIFYPGNHRNYKNLENLISAYARSELPKLGCLLKITGDPAPELRKHVQSENVEKTVRFLGRLSDAEVVASYKGAACVAFLSRYEGFGLPILEAMACSVPVVVANSSCLPEIAGDAAVIVDPDDLEAISDALTRVVTDPSLADSLRKRGAVRLRAFDPMVSSQRLWSIIEQTGGI